MPVKKVNFPLSALSPFLHSSSFPSLGIEKKTHGLDISAFDLEELVFCLVKLVVPQVKCDLLCFVLVLGEMILGPGGKASDSGDLVFELEELIVPLVYTMCFSFFLGDLVLAPGEMILGLGEKEYNFGKNYPRAFFLINNLLVINFRWWT